VTADRARLSNAGSDPATEAFFELLRLTHFSTPSGVGDAIAGQAAFLGAHDVALYVIDYEQTTLVPLAPPDGPSLSVTGTLPGRSFTSTTGLRSATDDGTSERLWMPLIDGTDRLGVMGMSFPTEAIDERLLLLCERYAHLAAILLIAKSAYGDAIECARRQRPMTIASELAWALAPPSVFATDGLVLAGMLEPSYDNGGDAFDYAANGRTLHVAVFDAMGHGLAAAGVAAFAVSAYRQSRRTGSSLTETYDAMDGAVGDQFPDERFVTALIAELDLDSGRLQLISAGHPLPLVLRHGRRASTLTQAPTTPLGVPSAAAPHVADVSLEPGDLLLFYTDGLSEAPRRDGGRFGVGGLGEFVERAVAAGLTVPETLRRLRQTFLDAADAGFDDDASAILVEWRGGGHLDLLPQTVAY
jgi:serine/threonine protein phosphatase PrpC